MHIATMRLPVTLSVLSALIAASLAAPQNPGTESAKLNTVSQGQVTGIQKRASGNVDNCQCVPYYLCENNTLIVDGKHLIDIRSGGPSHTVESINNCSNYLEFCCAPEKMLSPEDMITPKPKTRRGCGQRNPNGLGCTITGNNNKEAQFAEFPWMVAILLKEEIDANIENSHHCGGSLIHSEAVLTAAHCVDGMQPYQIKIRAGEWDTQTDAEIFPHQDRDVEKIIKHENYLSSTLFNDIAILILKTPVHPAGNVDFVCLPQQDEVFNRNRCFATGWGKDQYGVVGQYQVILKSIDVPIVPRYECQTTLRRIRVFGENQNIDPSFLCAGGEAGTGPCEGDGGGPLVCPLKNDPTRYAQAGIVSWGIGCSELSVPAVYVNVAFLRQWIDDQMAYNGLDISIYQA